MGRCLPQVLTLVQPASLSVTIPTSGGPYPQILETDTKIVHIFVRGKCLKLAAGLQMGKVHQVRGYLKTLAVFNSQRTQPSPIGRTINPETYSGGPHPPHRATKEKGLILGEHTNTLLQTRFAACTATH